MAPAGTEEPGAKPDPAPPAASGFPITVKLVSKTFSPSDYEADKMWDTIDFEFRYTNTGKADVRAFHVGVLFRDLFDELRYGFSLKVSDPVKAGASGVWRGSMRVNPFEADDAWARNTDLKDIVVKIDPRRIIYADGTSKKFE